MEAVKHTDTKTLLDMKLKGMSYRAIAAKVGMGKSAVQARVTGIYAKLEKDDLEAYNKHEDAILTYAKHVMVQHAVRPEVVEKASLNNVAYAYTQFNSAQRLLRGESTANHSIKGIIDHHQKTLEDLQTTLATLEDG